MMVKTSPTTLAGLEARLRLLEATDSVRWVMARYMELCDVPQPELDIAELGSLFTEDAIWKGIGPEYDSKFGQHAGRNAIAAMLATYLPPSNHFAANAHVLSEGRINVIGKTCSGAWIMQQLATYPDGRKELLVARITANFELDDAVARISTFRTQRLFAVELTDSAAAALAGASLSAAQ